jgi:hypothetical protein
MANTQGGVAESVPEPFPLVVDVALNDAVGVIVMVVVVVTTGQLLRWVPLKRACQQNI